MGFSKDLYTTIIMSVLFVAGIATVVPTLLAIVGDLGGENKGIVTSLYTFILFIGASLGPIISTGIMQTGALTLPFIIFGCILLGSLLLTLSLKKNCSEKRNQWNKKEMSGTSSCLCDVPFLEHHPQLDNHEDPYAINRTYGSERRMNSFMRLFYLRFHSHCRSKSMNMTYQSLGSV